MNLKEFFYIPSSIHATKRSFWQVAINFFIAFAILGTIFFAFFANQIYDWKGIYEYRSLFINGWLTTLWISLASLVLSFLIGLGSAIARRSRLLVLRYIALIYVEFIRGTPLLVQILFFFYVAANTMGIDSRYLVGILTLSMFSGAYISEMIRSGIENISESQIDSARAIGLTRLQTYSHVIFPQAFRQILPPLTGQFASLVKDSSLLSIIGISELTNSAQQVNSATYSTLESFFPLAIGYLLLTLPISILSKHLEEKYRYAS